MVLIVDALDKDPASRELFLFRNRAGNTLADVFTLSHNQLQWLLSGINFMTQKVKKPHKIKHYY